MAIGTAAAIGLGVTALGAGASAISSNKASKRAAETSTENNAVNTALARDIYGQNQQALMPFMQRGNDAGNSINALLGLGGGAQQQQQMQPNAFSQFQGQYSGNAGSPYGLGDTAGLMGMGNSLQGGGDPYAAYVRANPDLQAEFGRVSKQFGGDIGAYGQFHYNRYGQSEGRQLPNMAPQQQQGPTPVVPVAEAAPIVPGQPRPASPQQQAATNAFDIFRGSTGYQFRVNEGMDALNSGFAGAGLLQSGAALKSLDDYRQGMASGEFGNYVNALGTQQAVGAGAASSLAGVGQNFASTVINGNNFNAHNQMGAQLGRQNVFGNALGTLGGAGLGFLSGGR